MTSLGRFTLLASGERFYVHHPEQSVYTLHDMALGIARQCRFNGQFSGYMGQSYSVAQHSILVDDIVDVLMGAQDARPWAILHDAPEGIIGDMITPVKAHCPEFYNIENLLEADMLRRVGVSVDDRIRDIVKWADIIACSMEAEELSGFTHEDWGLPKPPCSIRDMYPDFHVWSIDESYERYVGRVTQLVGYF